MLIFVDESGDIGRRLAEGATEHFTVTMVIFEDHDVAQAVDERINALRHELGRSERFEFHFTDNSDNIREAFLEAVSPFEFFYLSFVINKAKLSEHAFPSKSHLYNWVCGTVFENAKPYLDNAIVKTDQCGNREFQRELASYLRRRINDPNRTHVLIKKVTPQDSRSNNLLQMADMICGAVARSFRTDRSNLNFYRQKIKHRELSVRFWPE